MLSRCQGLEHPDVTRIGHGLKEAGEHRGYQLVRRGTGSVLAGNLCSTRAGVRGHRGSSDRASAPRPAGVWSPA